MKLLQVAQRAIDLDRAVRFYEQTLGAELVARFDPPGLAFFRVGELRLLLDRGAPSALIYIEVPDARTSFEELREAGVEVDTEPHCIFVDDDGIFGEAGWEEWMAFIRDSEGNVVGLASRQPPGPAG
jgi:catechol 2,3-dioxygenase-like lactoylglutathione lyase family enzyme